MRLGVYEPIHCSSKLLLPPHLHLSILRKQCSHMRSPIAGCLGKDQGPEIPQVSGILGLPDEGGYAVPGTGENCSRGDPIMTLTGRRCSPALSTLHMHPAMLSPGPVALPTWKSSAGVPRVQHRASSTASTGNPGSYHMPFPAKGTVWCYNWAAERALLSLEQGPADALFMVQTTPLNMLPRSQAGWSHGAG